jgi:hypothetical protein
MGLRAVVPEAVYAGYVENRPFGRDNRLKNSACDPFGNLVELAEVLP